MSALRVSCSSSCPSTLPPSLPVALHFTQPFGTDGGHFSPSSLPAPSTRRCVPCRRLCLCLACGRRRSGRPSTRVATCLLFVCLSVISVWLVLLVGSLCTLIRHCASVCLAASVSALFLLLGLVLLLCMFCCCRDHRVYCFNCYVDTEL